MQDKVIVVTGAAGRLGQQVIQQFARRGATIAAVVRNEDEARSIPFPPDAEGWAFPGDVTDEDTVVACFEQIGRQFGHIDALIHTVGNWQAWSLRDTTLADWERILRTNLTSTFLCFREAAGLMEERGGRLIALASMQGADRGTARQAGYAAAKAGVIRLVEATAAEFEGTGITAHAIAPSTILYDEDDDASGVPATHIVDLCLHLCTEAGGALDGATLRAYGTQR